MLYQSCEPHSSSDFFNLYPQFKRCSGEASKNSLKHWNVDEICSSFCISNDASFLSIDWFSFWIEPLKSLKSILNVVHVFIIARRVNPEKKNHESWANQIQYISSRAYQVVSTFCSTDFCTIFFKGAFSLYSLGDLLAPNSREKLELIGCFEAHFVARKRSITKTLIFQKSCTIFLEQFRLPWNLGN